MEDVVKNLKLIALAAVLLALFFMLKPDKSYEECILENIKDVTTQYAAVKVDDVCNALYKPAKKQKTDFDYSTMLHDKAP